MLVWPENRTAVIVFIAMHRRWIVGMGGPVGLDLSALPLILDAESVRKRCGRIRRRDRRRITDALMVLEDEALQAMYEKDD